jgi:hypothetical protein
MLVINADDFGLNHTVNHAIIKSFELNLCSSTTLMANMPGFEEACCLAHEHRLLDHVGIHLVLKNGAPLTEAMKRSSRFCDGAGFLALTESSPIFTLATSERHLLAAEIRAQIARCRANGIFLTHLDSHYHLHTRWAILGVVTQVVRSEHIPFVRRAQNCTHRTGLRKRIYMNAVNRRINRAGLARLKYFGDLADYPFLNQTTRSDRQERSLEVMIHPVFHAEGFVTDEGKNEPLETLMESIESYREAISYNGARYG